MIRWQTQLQNKELREVAKDGIEAISTTISVEQAQTGEGSPHRGNSSKGETERGS